MRSGELERMARSSSLPHRTVVQAQGVVVGRRWCRERCRSARAVRHDGGRGACVGGRRFEVGRVEAVGSIAPGRGRKPGDRRGDGRRDRAMTRCIRCPMTGRRLDRRGRWRALRDRQGHRRSDLAGTESAAVAGRHVQAVERPGLRGEARRCRRAVPEPAGTGGGVQLRREDPVPGAGSHPAVACR